MIFAKVRKLVGYMPDKFGSYDNTRVREYLDLLAAFSSILRKETAETNCRSSGTHKRHTWMQDRFVESLSHGCSKELASLERCFTIRKF
ncbi:MAG: hypothetical protein R3C20_17860 [Planctomycetaceae bacterium]